MTVHFGDCRNVMRTLIAKGEKAQMCVTSPPYYGLRDYGVDGQMGLEPTLQEYINTMVEAFSLVWELLEDDGTCWINIGDTYASNGGHGWQGKNGDRADGSFTAVRDTVGMREVHRRPPKGLKPKDMMCVPWRLGLALQEWGWYLRQDVIWCLSGGTWVYASTQKGEMPVMVKDLVRLDPASVRLWNGEKWTQALGWGPSNDTTERIELVLRSGERIGCTGGHVWPTQRGNVKARDIVAGDVIDSCDLPEPDDACSPGYLTNDALWLIGLFLAEGSWTKGKIQISLHANEVPRLERIDAVARYYGGSSSHTLSGNNLSVRLYGPILPVIIRAYIGGNVAADKHLKVATWRLPNASLRHIVDGYLDGDGHDDPLNERWRLGFCRNYALERDLRVAAARLGATLTLHPRSSKFQNGSSPSFRGEWRWHRSGHHNEKARAEVIEIRRSRARRFWDIAVEDEPHLFALASGVLTHNCKPNPMPESVKDRCTKAHEYMLMLAKSEHYYFDFQANQEPVSGTANARGRGVNPKSQKVPSGWDTSVAEGAHGSIHCEGRSRDSARSKQNASMSSAINGLVEKRNRRSVWTVQSQPFSGAHFATFPPALIAPCILAGSRPGDVVFDPFFGSGTTGQVCNQLGRQYIGIELNRDYESMQRERCSQQGLAL